MLITFKVNIMKLEDGITLTISFHLQYRVSRGSFNYFLGLEHLFCLDASFVLLQQLFYWPHLLICIGVLALPGKKTYIILDLLYTYLTYSRQSVREIKNQS